MGLVLSGSRAGTGWVGAENAGGCTKGQWALETGQTAGCAEPETGASGPLCGVTVGSGVCGPGAQGWRRAEGPHHTDCRNA